MHLSAFLLCHPILLIDFLNLGYYAYQIPPHVWHYINQDEVMMVPAVPVLINQEETRKSKKRPRT